MVEIAGNDEKYFIDVYQQLVKCCNIPEVDDTVIKSALNEFVNVYDDRAVTNNSGGVGKYPSAWIFLIAKLFDPKIIVESGVWKGHTSWLFRKACPSSDIHSFDISLGMLECRLDDVNYYAHHWMSNDVVKNLDIDNRSFVYFDDHINQCLRVKQAYDMGFKYILFDDNEPVVNASYNVGMPACPTLQLLFSNVEYGDHISYERKGEKFVYEYQKADVHDAKKYIKNYYILPDTACSVTFVELID